MGIHPKREFIFLQCTMLKLDSPQHISLENPPSGVGMSGMSVDSSDPIFLGQVDIADAFEGTGPGDFILQAKKCALRVTALKNAGQDHLRSEYSELLSKLPLAAHRKVSEEIKMTVIGVDPNSQPQQKTMRSS